MFEFEKLIIKDGNKNLIFTMRKMPAWQTFKYANQFLSFACESGKLPKETLSALFFAAVGLSNGEIDKEEVENLLKNGIVDLSITFLIEMLSNLTSERQDQLIEPLISCLSFIGYSNDGQSTESNGEAIQLTLENMSNYISNFTNIYNLAFNVLKYHYKVIFDKVFTDANQNSQI